MAAYDNLALCYDRLMDFDYRRLCDFYEAEFAGRGTDRRGATLLDLACGTGRVLAEFCRRGYDVTGVDISPGMLGAAAGNCAGFDDVLLVCQDMRELDLNDTVDFAVCALDAVNHLESVADLRRMFARVNLFLNPGGVFVFDVHSRHKFFEVLADNSFVYDFEDVFCFWNCILAEDDRRIDHSMDFFIKKGELFQRFSDEISEFFYTPEEVGGALSAAGFGEVYVNTGFDAERVFFTAVKRQIGAGEEI